MALGRQIVDFIRLHLPDDPDQGAAVGKVTVVEGDFFQQVSNPGGVGNGCPADNSVDRVALFQKKLGKIAAILAGDAGNQRCFHSIVSLFSLVGFIQ